jgi:hypothetical protein
MLDFQGFPRFCVFNFIGYTLIVFEQNRFFYNYIFYFEISLC